MVSTGNLLEPIVRTVLLRATFGGGQSIPTDGPAAATVIDGGLEFQFVIVPVVGLMTGTSDAWAWVTTAPLGPSLCATATLTVG